MVEEYNNWQDIFSSQYEKITSEAGGDNNYPDSDEVLEVRKDAGIPIDLPEDADDKVEAELKAAYDAGLYIENGEDIEFEDYEHIVKHREKSPIKNLQSLKSDLKILESFQGTYDNRETSEEMDTLLGNADELSGYDGEVLNHYFEDDSIDTDQLLVDMAQHGDVPTYLNTTANLLSGYAEEELIPSMIEETQKSDADIDLGDLFDGVVRDQIVEIETQLFEVEKKVEFNSYSIEEIEGDMEEVNSRIDAINQTIESIEVNVQSNSDDIDQLRSDLEDYGDRLEDLEENYEELQAKLDEQEDRLDDVEDELDEHPDPDLILTEDDLGEGIDPSDMEHADGQVGHDVTQDDATLDYHDKWS